MLLMPLRTAPALLTRYRLILRVAAAAAATADGDDVDGDAEEESSCLEEAECGSGTAVRGINEAAAAAEEEEDETAAAGAAPPCIIRTLPADITREGR